MLSKDKNIKATILWGDLYSANRGINALTISLIDLLKEKYPKINFNIFAGSIKEENVKGDIVLYPIYKYCIPFKLKYLNIVRYLKLFKIAYSSDIVIDLSEGDSFTDIYGIKRFLCHYYIKYFFCNFSKRYYLAPQTIGPFTEQDTIQKALNILKKTKHLSTRDDISKNYIHDLLGNNKNIIQVYPDLAVSLKPKKPKNYAGNVCFTKGKCVGINVSGLLWNKGYTKNNEFNLCIDYQQLCYQLAKYFITQGKKVLFIPHTYSVNINEVVQENDLSAIHELMVILKTSSLETKNIGIVDEEYSANELKWFISKMDFFIGARMHACIAAFSTGVPFVGLSYSRKFEGLFGFLGFKELIADLRNDPNVDVKVVDIYNNKDMVKGNIIECSENIIKDAKKYIDNI